MLPGLAGAGMAFSGLQLVQLVRAAIPRVGTYITQMNVPPQTAMAVLGCERLTS